MNISIVARAHAELKRNIHRQLKVFAMKLPSGIPARLAVVIPKVMSDTAVVCFCGMSLLATIDPVPKKEPCERPEMKRAASPISKVGLTAKRRFPAHRKAISRISILRRSQLRRNIAQRGAPTHTPIA